MAKIFLATTFRTLSFFYAILLVFFHYHLNKLSPTSTPAHKLNWQQQRRRQQKWQSQEPHRGQIKGKLKQGNEDFREMESKYEYPKVHNSSHRTILNQITNNNVATQTEKMVDANARKGSTSIFAHNVASLSCSKYGGPHQSIATKEVVYWEDIASDIFLEQHSSLHKTKFNNSTSNQKDEDESNYYLTFEMDIGGWNNVRMAFETALVLSLAMGRTLVLPPKIMYGKNGSEYGISDFFDIDSIINNDNTIVNIISFEEFLKREAMEGKLRHSETLEISFPPGNRTNWDKDVTTKKTNKQQRKVLFNWLRSVTKTLPWEPYKCVAAFPSNYRGMEAENILQRIWNISKTDALSERHVKEFVEDEMRPIPVDSSPEERLKEMTKYRDFTGKAICIYSKELQQQKVLHIPTGIRKFRLLLHFYGYVYFENWKHDLLIKRFIRDQVRYNDEIQCAAARIINRLRNIVEETKTGFGYDDNEGRNFNTMHIRRGDFSSFRPDTQIQPIEIYNDSYHRLIPNSTLYIATDENPEKMKDFFHIFRKHYNVYFLNDFIHGREGNLLDGVHANYYPMIDQLIASRGKNFVGTYYSTFTGYINRLRGYYSQLHQTEGYQEGILSSYHYTPIEHKDDYRHYRPIEDPIFAREFPTCWRDINYDVNT